MHRDASRFNKVQLIDLESNFRRHSVDCYKEVPTDDGKTKKVKVRVMEPKQFRNIMGLLGQNDHPFLADRIYTCFDKDNDGQMDFSEFTRVMDILCNGSDQERHEFSFRLMDIDEKGHLNF